MTQTLSKTKRIITLDLIRGYLLLVILINHLNRIPGFFDIFTGRGQLWTSAAEGFFLISGVLVGIVRGREVKAGQFWRATKKMLFRGFYLYFWTIALTVVFTLIGMHFLSNPGLKPGIMVINSSDAHSFVARLLTLRYVYGWADFLQYYAVYMLIAPLFLFLLSRRLALPALLITLYAFTLKNHNYIFVWQIYFFLGVVLGYYWQNIDKFIQSHSHKRKAAIRYALYGLALITLALDAVGVFIFRLLDRHGLISADTLGRSLSDLHSLSTSWFNRNDSAQPYGYGRIFISFIWFSALYAFIRQHEGWIKRYLGRLLLPVGCNPLLVYGFDSFLIFGCNLIWRHDLSFEFNTLINGVAILLTLAAASLQIKRRRSQNTLAV